jgi:hypothetical protein
LPTQYSSSSESEDNVDEVEFIGTNQPVLAASREDAPPPPSDDEGASSGDELLENCNWTWEGRRSLQRDYAPPEVSEGNLKAAVASPQKRMRRTRDKPTPKPGFIYY